MVNNVRQKPLMPLFKHLILYYFDRRLATQKLLSKLNVSFISAANAIRPNRRLNNIPNSEFNNYASNYGSSNNISLNDIPFVIAAASKTDLVRFFRIQNWEVR